MNEPRLCARCSKPLGARLMNHCPECFQVAQSEFISERVPMEIKTPGLDAILKDIEEHDACVKALESRLAAAEKVVMAAREMAMHLTPQDIIWGHESFERLTLAIRAYDEGKE